MVETVNCSEVGGNVTATEGVDSGGAETRPLAETS